MSVPTKTKAPHLFTWTDIPVWLQMPKTDHGDHYTEWTWEEILSRTMAGYRLEQICADPTMPKRERLIRWLGHPDNAEYMAQYEEARRIGTLALEEEALAIADGLPFDPSDPDMPAIPDDVTRAKLRVETRWKSIRAWNADRYGDKKQVDMSIQIDVRDAMARAAERVIEGTVVRERLTHDG